MYRTALHNIASSRHCHCLQPLTTDGQSRPSTPNSSEFFYLFSRCLPQQIAASTAGTACRQVQTCPSQCSPSSRLRCCSPGARAPPASCGTGAAGGAPPGPGGPPAQHRAPAIGRSPASMVPASVEQFRVTYQRQILGHCKHCTGTYDPNK